MYQHDDNFEFNSENYLLYGFDSMDKIPSNQTSTHFQKQRIQKRNAQHQDYYRAEEQPETDRQPMAYKRQKEEDRCNLQDLTNSFFKVKIVNKTKNHKIEFAGSNRLLSILKYLIGGVLLLYLVNVCWDNNCDEQYLSNRCNENKGYKCNKLQSCIEERAIYYFSVQENIVIFMIWVFMILVWHCSRPLNLKWEMTKLL